MNDFEGKLKIGTVTPCDGNISAENLLGNFIFSRKPGIKHQDI
jgi:hypothetical protein